MCRSSFLNSGQICLCTSRIFVHQSIYDAFLQRFLDQTRKLVVGPPQDPSTFMGPINNKPQLHKVESAIDLARQEGVTVFSPELSQLPAAYVNGFFLAPHVLTNVADDSALMQEEIFGPVTCIVPFDTEESVVQRVNDVPYGLCAAIFSSSVSRIHCIAPQLECADAFRMLTVAYGEATLDRSNVYRWYKMFSEGREDVNDEERAGRPSTSTTDEKINEVEKMILANRGITVREVAEDLNISIGSCHSIFINDLGMRRLAVKFVPKLLNCDQKQHRMNIANEMLDSVRDDPNLLQRVITGDGAWDTHESSYVVQVGTVWCNCWLIRNLHMPFGGHKASGVGMEGTHDSKEFYTLKRSICLKV
ncbi:hypothetical protein LAZ67_9001875 [Cordylochernes scorpioides]|uniref:Aldehyde dehydrogenase domain-containing protein n=1 Tax=Cordylochernes scorpioides TaxID=51811 RepID=A0ABY6KVD7_9ARAC|nr:hypothetical protein LAZ67_9001875 [Cordylochernes scorpioides]